MWSWPTNMLRMVISFNLYTSEVNKLFNDTPANRRGYS